jgi:L-arabinokinase
MMLWSIDRSTSPSQAHSSDVERFLTHINTTNFFDGTSPLYVARAPGRLDLMGGIADYSGSLVLEFPLAAATLVAVQQVPTATVSILSVNAAEIGVTPLVTLPLETLCPEDGPLDYAHAKQLLTTDPLREWAAYVAGVMVVLQRECHLSLEYGVNIMVYCEVPIGKGVSSSASLEVATMQALSTLFHCPLSGQRLAQLCQIVENYIVGAACGIMDHMTSACGEQDSLLSLLCQPAELQTPISLPPSLEVWGIASGVRHTVSGSDYTTVRVGAFMGYRIIAELAGLKVEGQEEQYVDISDPLWGGYLANIPPSIWETRYRDHIPYTMSGKAFLARYGGSTDRVTRIDPTFEYALRQPTAHPIYENHRVRLFQSLLQSRPLGDEQLALLGELMYQSHCSYSACGLGSQDTDLLVELVRQAGFYGAKITGGGGGGTVAVLAKQGMKPQIDQIAAHYEQQTNRHAIILGQSSPGAVAWGIVQLVASSLISDATY